MNTDRVHLRRSLVRVSAGLILAFAPHLYASVLSVRLAEGEWSSGEACANIGEDNTLVCEVRVTNQLADTQQFHLQQSSVVSGFVVKYTHDDTDITTAVQGEGWLTGDILSGESVVVECRVRAQSGESDAASALQLCAAVEDDPSDDDAPVDFPTGYVILAGGDMTWTGTGSTDLSGGVAHTNGSFKMTGSNTIRGDVSSVSRIWCTGSSVIDGDATAPVFKGKSPGNVTGDARQTGVETVAIPDIALTAYYAQALANSEVYDGDQHFTGSSQLTPSGGIMWVDGDLQISGSGDMVGCFIATGDIKISGSGDQVNVDDFPAVISVTGDIDISGSGAYHGLIYTKNGDFEKSGSGDVIGCIICAGEFRKTGSWTLLRYEDCTPVYPASDGTLHSVMLRFPSYTMWAIDQSSSRLHYYVIAEDAAYLEGAVTGITSSHDVEAFTIDSTGVMYFMNNSGTSKLYKILPESLDMDSSTSACSVFVGDTGLSAGSGSNEITSLQFIDGVLYGIGKESKAVHAVSTVTGCVTQVGTLNIAGSFRVDGLTQGADGTVYLSKTKNADSELWRFSCFPDGALEKVCDITGSLRVQALAAHPDGCIYAVDGLKTFRVDPKTRNVAVADGRVADLEGADFCYQAEEQKLKQGTLTINLSAAVTDESTIDGRGADLQVAVSGQDYVGDGVYNSGGGGQSCTTASGSMTAAEYLVRVENDGTSACAFTINEKHRGHDSWIVRYFDAVEGGQEISDGVEGDGWSTGTLAAGECRTIRVVVVPGARQDSLQIQLSGTPTDGSGGEDTVKMTTTKQTGGSGARIRVQKWQEK